MSEGPGASVLPIIRPSLQMRLLSLPLIAALPGTCLGLFFLWREPISLEVRWLVTIAIVLVSILVIRSLNRSVQASLRTVSGLLSALREGDYAIRAATKTPTDAFSEILVEINAFGESLQRERFGSVESAVLLGKVLEEIDVAVLGFDQQTRLKLLNRRARSMLGGVETDRSGQSAAELGVDDWLTGASPRVVDVTSEGNRGRWELRRGSYYETGEKYTLLFLSDLTPALREEERQAWKRLLQVLRHEVNNSLAPIQSLSSSLRELAGRDEASSEWSPELREGLEVISNRSKSLSRFLSAYTRLAALPEPDRSKLDVADMVRTVVALERRMVVKVTPGPAIEIDADVAQIEQLLINIIRNAVEAALENQGSVELSWHVHRGSLPMVEIVVSDSGLGIANSDNLFVPFYTTKSDGSGIGLVLSRQIAEAHGGTLTVENREGGLGCLARLRLPAYDEIRSIAN